MTYHSWRTCACAARGGGGRRGGRTSSAYLPAAIYLVCPKLAATILPSSTTALTFLFTYIPAPCCVLLYFLPHDTAHSPGRRDDTFATNIAAHTPFYRGHVAFVLLYQHNAV